MSRTYKDQRQFDRKQEYRNKQSSAKPSAAEDVWPNENHYDVMQSFTPNDWDNF